MPVVTAFQPPSIHGLLFIQNIELRCRNAAAAAAKAIILAGVNPGAEIGLRTGIVYPLPV